MKFRRGNIAKLSDNELVWLFADTRGKEYFGELYLRYLPLVYGVCLKYSDEEGAKKAIREIYDSISEKLIREAEYYGDFREWLFEATKSFILKKSPITNPDEGYIEGRACLESKHSHCIEMINRDYSSAEDIIKNPKVNLTKPQKACLKMFFQEKMSYADIADKAGYLLENIKGHILSGIESISEYLNKDLLSKSI